MNKMNSVRVTCLRLQTFKFLNGTSSLSLQIQCCTSCFQVHHLRIGRFLRYMYSLDNSVGIATRLRLYDRRIGVRIPTGVRDFSSLHSIKTESGSTQTPIQRVPKAVYPVLKPQGHEAYHLPPQGVEAKCSGAPHPLIHASSQLCT
jgi:hypothetical protein